METKVRYRIRRITDGKFLFPLKYSRSSYFWNFKCKPNWTASGRNYTTFNAAKNELDREIEIKQQKGVEIVKVTIQEHIERVDGETPKLSFCDWIGIINSK